MLRSLLSASVFTNAPRSGITLFVEVLFVKDDLTLTEGRVVCCLLGASCLGGPGIPPELRFSSKNINSSQIQLRIGISKKIAYRYKLYKHLPIGMAGSGAPGPALGGL